MIAGEYTPGWSVKQAAKSWGIDRHTCERYAVEAGKAFRLVSDRGAVRNRAMARLDEIAQEGRGDRVPALLGLVRMAGALDPLPGQEMTRAERVKATIEALMDPDEELLEALQHARKDIYRILFSGKRKAKR